MMFCALMLVTDRCGMYIGQTVRIHWCNQSSWPPRLPMMPGWQMGFCQAFDSDRCFCSIKPCCRAKFWVSRCVVLLGQHGCFVFRPFGPILSSPRKGSARFFWGPATMAESARSEGLQFFSCIGMLLLEIPSMFSGCSNIGAA